jgi:D-amino-acid dehydrogenase
VTKVLVLGAGVVGLASAWYLRKRGFEVTLVDRDPAGDKASFGNAGAIAVTECMPAAVPGLLAKVPRWLFDPLGPLAIRPAQAPRLLPWLWAFLRAGRLEEVRRIAVALAALNDEVYGDWPPLLAELGIEDELRRSGALVLYRDRGAYEADHLEWEIKAQHGVVAELLSRAEILELEPAIGPVKAFGVLLPDWSIVGDPKRIVDRLRERLVEEGMTIETGEVVGLSGEGRRVTGARLRDGRQLEARRVVAALGAWSGAIAKSAGDRVLLESERGYNTTIAQPGIGLNREIILAEEKFVVTPLDVGLRVGGAAEFAGLEAPPNYKRSMALLELARRVLPDLATEAAKPWMGQRSSTPDSLPVIGPSPRLDGLFYAFGHGHLGLTHAATTGRLLAQAIAGETPTIDLTPFSIARFAG